MTMRIASDDTHAEAQGRWLRALGDAWPRAICRLLEAGEPLNLSTLTLSSPRPAFFACAAKNPSTSATVTGR